MVQNRDKAKINVKILSVGIVISVIVFWLFSPFRIGIGFFATYKKDVSKNEKVWGGYKLEAVYEVVGPIFIRNYSFHGGKKVVLIPPRGEIKDLGLMLYEAPPSIELYKNNKKRWPQIIGVIDKGTKIDKLVKSRRSNQTWL